ncbi:unnamed protein product [Absidia cylindrospora]
MQHLEHMLTTYLTIHHPPIEQERAPVPRHASLLFETTTKKLTRHRTSLEKQVLLKQLYSKLQTTKRHGMILLDHPKPSAPKNEWSYLHNKGHQRYYQKKHQRPLVVDDDDDDDDVPLGALLSNQPQHPSVKDFHRSGICAM